MGATKFCFLAILLLLCAAQVLCRICYTCNVALDPLKPWDRVSCDKVGRDIMRNGSLHTVTCPDDQYCMLFKGLYRDKLYGPQRYNEYGGCSGKDNIYNDGSIGPETANGTFVKWKTPMRVGELCLSLDDKGCFECEKSKCDEFWPKPNCPNGTQMIVEESLDECCTVYKCVPLRTCHYCNIMTDIWDPLNIISCETVKKAIMRNSSLYTMQCPHNEYCMYYKGMYKHRYFTPEFSVEYAGCSGKEEGIYIGYEKGPGNTDGYFVDYKTIKRNGRICLSAREKGCFGCNKSQCDKFWPKPDCRTGILMPTDESSTECCPQFKCIAKSTCTVIILVVLLVIIIAIIGVSSWLVEVKQRRGDTAPGGAESTAEVSVSQKIPKLFLQTLKQITEMTKGSFLLKEKKNESEETKHNLG